MAGCNLTSSLLDVTKSPYIWHTVPLSLFKVFFRWAVGVSVQTETFSMCMNESRLGVSFSLRVYLWKQRNSENKDPISVITSNNSLVGFSSVRPLCVSASLRESLLYRAELDLNLRQLLYSYYTVLKHTEERTYGRSACKYIKSLFSFFLLKYKN